jgi:hypothetical protein
MDLMDRIEKQVTLLAPVSRVWPAITDARAFADRFGVNLEGGFGVGKAITGTFNKELDEAAIMEHQRTIGVSPSKVRQPENGFGFALWSGESRSATSASDGFRTALILTLMWKPNRLPSSKFT